MASRSSISLSTRFKFQKELPAKYVVDPQQLVEELLNRFGKGGFAVEVSLALSVTMFNFQSSNSICFFSLDEAQCLQDQSLTRIQPSEHPSISNSKTTMLMVHLQLELVNQFESLQRTSSTRSSVFRVSTPVKSR